VSTVFAKFVWTSTAILNTDRFKQNFQKGCNTRSRDIACGLQ